MRDARDGNGCNMCLDRKYLPEAVSQRVRWISAEDWFAFESTFVFPFSLAGCLHSLVVLHSFVCSSPLFVFCLSLLFSPAIIGFSYNVVLPILYFPHLIFLSSFFTANSCIFFFLIWFVDIFKNTFPVTLN